ncbi:MAG: metallophosphoesterase family protein [Pseudomonadota bacterium]
MDNERVKVSLVSDTHGVFDARVAEVVQGSDWIVHAGDIGGAGVLHQLAQVCANVVAVCGNNDTPRHWRSRDHDILHALPRERSLELPGGRLIVVHGDRITPASRRHERLRQHYPDARVVVYGHSHRMCEDLERRPWVLNPGAAGRSRTYGGPSCMVLHIENSQWRITQHRFSPSVRGTGEFERGG